MCPKNSIKNFIKVSIKEKLYFSLIFILNIKKQQLKKFYKCLIYVKRYTFQIKNWRKDTNVRFQFLQIFQINTTHNLLFCHFLVKVEKDNVGKETFWIFCIQVIKFNTFKFWCYVIMYEEKTFQSLPRQCQQVGQT